ncbi:hypothetical protein DOT90_15555 [Clavibacter michiganensis subsp. michiganensis]|nr:hypothetical protein [Clavibacter michiganensis subsp. michiganensis]
MTILFPLVSLPVIRTERTHAPQRRVDLLCDECTQPSAAGVHGVTRGIATSELHVVVDSATMSPHYLKMSEA